MLFFSYNYQISIWASTQDFPTYHRISEGFDAHTHSLKRFTSRIHKVLLLSSLLYIRIMSC